MGSAGAEEKGKEAEEMEIPEAQQDVMPNDEQ